MTNRLLTITCQTKLLQYLPKLLLVTFSFLYSLQSFAQDDSVDVGGAEAILESHEDTLIVDSDSTMTSLLKEVIREHAFDSAIIPARHYYGLWDTITVNPYDKDLTKMQDTVLIPLIDNEGCGFTPPYQGKINSGFGYRRWGRRMKFHYGMDIDLETGDTVVAAFDGVVRVAKRSYDYGYMVIVRHYNGIETLYAHFSKLLVSNGQVVKAGEPVGLGGSTGHSTGSHLHFEVRFKGEKINPNDLISFDSYTLKSDTLYLDKGNFAYLKEIRARKYHTIRSGDTLGHIARRYGTTVTQLCRLNGMSRKSILRIGRRLRVR